MGNLTARAWQKKAVFFRAFNQLVISSRNYLGAIRNWVSLQNDFESIYCVITHAITVHQDPSNYKSTREVAVCLIAQAFLRTTNSIQSARVFSMLN